MKVFYFTATGNSLYVAKRIGGKLYSIPQMIKEHKYEFEDDAIGFVFPCYVFGLPRLVRDFVIIKHKLPVSATISETMAITGS
jgi:Protein involved in ribonucleotide reduction